MITVPPGRTSATRIDPCLFRADGFDLRRRRRCRRRAPPRTHSPAPCATADRQPPSASRPHRRRRLQASARSAPRRGSQRHRPPRCRLARQPRRQHASGSTIAATSGARPGGTAWQVDCCDAFRHDDPFRIGTCEEDEFAALLTARTTVARQTGSRVGGHDAPAVDDAAELVPEDGAGEARERRRMPAPVRLQVGGVP